MATCSFRDLEAVCIALGLKAEQITDGVIYKGFANGKFCRIVLHIHARGRDIATGTFVRYVKDLGFKNANEFFDYMRRL